MKSQAKRILPLPKHMVPREERAERQRHMTLKTDADVKKALASVLREIAGQPAAERARPERSGGEYTPGHLRARLIGAFYG